MMLIPCQIKASSVHGLGCFSLVNVKKGQPVWVYSELVDRRLPLAAKSKFTDVYGYVLPGEDVIEVPGDAALFINHSIDPNVYYLDPTSAESLTVALRDIAPGEEILENYYEFDENPESGGKLS